MKKRLSIPTAAFCINGNKLSKLCLVGFSYEHHCQAKDEKRNACIGIQFISKIGTQQQDQ
jgi:hypothetical protein